MCRITLIATGHTDHGLCNSNELYKIIEQIAPEIIFEEVPPSKFSKIYEGLLTDNLETKTIKRYLQNHPIDHFPVDIDTNDSFEIQIRKDMNELFNIFDQYSHEYNNFNNHHIFLSKQFGFQYLNSEDCSDLLERKLFFEKDILNNIKNEDLSNIYKNWLEFIDMRRNEIIKNIYSYKVLNKYKSALLLVGAEHRKPIIDKIKKIEKNNKPQLTWIFNYFT